MLSAPPVPRIPRPVPRRLPERQSRVTLIAGMVCSDGIVLCGDTELTLTSLKASRSKIFVAPRLKDFRVAIAGAGDYDYCKPPSNTQSQCLRLSKAKRNQGSRISVGN
jgi:hypothetical protein